VRDNDEINAASQVDHTWQIGMKSEHESAAIIATL